MIRVLLIDDEIPAIERLKKLLRPYVDIDVVGEAHDGISALTAIEEKKPDLVFLDIDMPELSGLEVAKTLGISGPSIVFATAFDEYALEAFEANAIDYIVKPINTSRLGLTIEKVRRSLLANKKPALEAVLTKLQKGAAARLAVKIGSRYEVFDPSEISVVLAKDHYASLLLGERELLSDDSLESVLSRLDPAVFLRVHRGAILNIEFLKELKREGDRKYTAILDDKLKTEVPVSRERLPQLKSILGLD